MTKMRIAGLAGKASTVSFLLTGALLSCGGHGTRVTQEVRTCADRWNQSNMIGWGPGPAYVDFRRPNAKERSSIQLSPDKQCIVSTPAGDGTWTCVLSDTGAYWCPPLHEPTGPPLTTRDATMDRRGRLKLDSPLNGTHPARPLAWQRYPHADGFVHPWTPSGSLRPGLRFQGKGRGRCFVVDETALDGISCLTARGERYDACFPRRLEWHRGDLAACGWVGGTSFTRWTITGGKPWDPPLLVPWHKIGSFSLGETKAGVLRDYGPQPRGGYKEHSGRVQVGFDHGRVVSLWFSTPYYRTKSGFGVGSRIPPDHRWHGFVWNAWVREKPCSCWVKVGLGRRSLPATAKNFLKPWFFINVRHGRVTSFYWALRFVD